MHLRSSVAALALTAACLVSPMLARASSWPEFGRDVANTNASDETWLTPSLVGQLSQDWTSLQSNSIVSGPVVVHDTVFCATLDGTVSALSLTDGSPLWSTPLGGPIYGSLASRGGRLYAGDLTCTVYCLKQSTGEIMWSRQVGDPTYEGFFGGASLAQDRVLLGVSTFTGDSPCSHGRLVALDKSTGDSVWTWNAVDDTSTGGGIWNTSAVEWDESRVYVATANPCTGNAGNYTNAIVCLNAVTGAIVWSFQAIPRDMEDMGFGGSPVLFSTGDTVVIRGVAVGNKDGNLWALNRETGELLWTAPLAGKAGVTGDIGVISTSAVWNGLLIIGTGSIDVDHPGSITAVDAASGEIVWRHDTMAAVYGPIAVINGIVVSTDGLNPTLLALNAATGDSLYQATLGSGTGGVFGGPTISHGYLLVPNMDYYISAFTVPGLIGIDWSDESERTPRALSLTAARVAGHGVRFTARGDNMDGSRVDVFDVSGRIIASVWLRTSGPGEATGTWDGRGRGARFSPAGAYLARSSGGAVTRFVTIDR